MAVDHSPAPAPIRSYRAIACVLAGISVFVAAAVAVDAVEPVLSGLSDPVGALLHGGPAQRIVLGVNVVWFTVAALYLRRKAASPARSDRR